MYTCLVCSESSDGLHFGIYACRACAAFFRRSVLQQRKYVCRRDGNCPIGNDARNMCRSCRFKKCIKLGMSTKKCTKDPPHLVNILAEQPQPSTSKRSPAENEPIDLSLAGMVPRLPKPPVSTTVSVISSSFPPPDTPFLDQMLRGYEVLVTRRRTIHRSTNVFGNKHPVKLFDPNIVGMVPGDNDISLASVRVETSLLVDMLNDFFFPFSSFSEREKIYMFREFLGHYLTLDPIYYTSVIFPEKGDKRFYITEQRYFNVDCMEHFYKCNNNYTDPAKSAHYLSPIYNYILKFIKEPMVRLQLTTAELVAMYALSLYTSRLVSLEPFHPSHSDDDCDSLSERCMEAQKGARQAIYRELFQLCKQKGNDVAAAHRMGEIIGLITPVVTVPFTFLGEESCARVTLSSCFLPFGPLRASFPNNSISPQARACFGHALGFGPTDSFGFWIYCLIYGWLPRISRESLGAEGA
uniref:Nuclear receptor domain-containing protein n=1 Tax=Steinernema glaseri TaxID=37863 RepID=A0A1I7YY10_9BILA